MQLLYNLNVRYAKLQAYLKEKKAILFKSKVIVEGLTIRLASRASLVLDSSSYCRIIYILDSPKFSSKLENNTIFEDQLVQVKNKLRSNHDQFLIEELKIIYISSRLEGSTLALTTLCLDIDNSIYYTSIKELYQYLSELYADPNYIKNARTSFKRLYQKDLTFQEFYTQFLRLIANRDLRYLDLKDKLNNKLLYKLQEVVVVYYNDLNVNTITFEIGRAHV